MRASMITRITSGRFGVGGGLALVVVTACVPGAGDGVSASEGPAPGGPPGSGSGVSSGVATSGGATSDGATTGGGATSDGATTGGATSDGATTTNSASAGSSGGGEAGFDGSPLAEPVTSEVADFVAMEVADVDGDGRADLILQGTGAPPRLAVHPGLADGRFGAGVSTEVSGFVGLVAGDVDGDGAGDAIVAGSGQPPRVSVHRGVVGGLGLAAAGVVTEVWNFDASRMVVGDLDGRCGPRQRRRGSSDALRPRR